VSGYLLTFRKAIWLHLLNSSIVRNYKTSCPRATTLHSYISEYTEFEATEFVFLKEKRANKNTENRKPRGKRQKERQLKLCLFLPFMFCFVFLFLDSVFYFSLALLVYLFISWFLSWHFFSLLQVFYFFLLASLLFIFLSMFLFGRLPFVPISFCKPFKIPKKAIGSKFPRMLSQNTQAVLFYDWNRLGCFLFAKILTTEMSS